VTPPLRVANCSGFYGDRLSAMREVLDDGPVEVGGDRHGARRRRG
jgi:hypothetical protein